MKIHVSEGNMAFWLEQVAQKVAQGYNLETHIGQDKDCFTCKDDS